MIKLQYIASSGNVYDLNAGQILTRTANFHKWAWGTEAVALQYGQRIAQFRKDAATYSAELILRGPQIHRRAIMDQLHEDMERDVKNQTPGRLIWQDWYIPCFALESSTEPDAIREWTSNTVSFLCPRPFWVREEKKIFIPASGDDLSGFLDYDYDYDYDFYKGTPGLEVWARTFPFSADFKIVIFGPITDPAIYVNGHVYQLLTEIYAGDYVTINSSDHTIILTQNNGTTVNLFDQRNKTSDIFERIPGGTITIIWSGLFEFEMTIYDERSEPTW